MKLTEWLWGTGPQSLQLKEASVSTRSRTTMPVAPILDVSLTSLGRYASKSELVYSCIEKKASAACDPELIVEKKTGDEWETVRGHPALETLLNPNPYDDGESFLKSWIASENIAGIFYAEIVRNGAGQPVQLFPLRPDLVFPQYIFSSKGQVIDYYAYRANGFEVRFKPEELLIRRRHGLGSMYSSMSPLAVALGSVDASIATTEYIRAFYNNGGAPSGILKIKGRNMSDEEAEAKQQRWQSRFGRGGRQQGGVAILDDSAEFQQVGSKLNELESESLTSIDETRICMAFGVPPVLIGAYVGLKNVNQKASFKGAMEEFWDNTMSPELKSIRKFLTRKYLPFFEDMDAIIREEIRFSWNMDTVKALQEDVNEIHTRSIEGYQASIMTLNEARQPMGLPPVDGEEGDAFYTAPVPEVDEDEPQEEGEVGQPKKLIGGFDPSSLPSGWTLTNDSAVPAEIYSRLVSATGNGTDPLKKKYEHDGMTLSREPTELEKSIDLKAIHDSYEASSLIKVCQSIRKDLIKQAISSIGMRTDADIYTLTLMPPMDAYKRVSKEIERAVHAGGGQINRAALMNGKAGFWTMHTKALIDDLIRRLVELTVSRIINEVQTAAANVWAMLGILGLERTEIENRMREELESRSDAPYERIANQGVIAAVNAGRREEMDARKDEIERYVYSAILDKNTCTTCEDWDGAEASDPSELPDTPNPECEGGGSCRCFCIAIFASEVS